MADILVPVGNGIVKRFRDNGDNSWSEVVYTGQPAASTPATASYVQMAGTTQQIAAVTSGQATIVVSTTPAYSAGDSVGGLLTLAGVTRSGLGALLQSLLLVDTSAQNAALEL